MESSGDSVVGGLALPVVRCLSCVAENVDWARRCARCGASLASPRAAASAEWRHLAYLLWQLGGWRQRDLISPETEQTIRTECTQRQQALRLEFAPAVATDPPIVPGLNGDQVALSAAERVRARYAGTAPPQRPVTPPFEVRKFAADHGIHIVFGLATALVLVALRSLLGWEFGSFFVPIIPLLLTLMFAMFGKRTRSANPSAAFVYDALFTVTLGFDLLIINRFWLGAAHLALPVRGVLPIATLLPATVAAMMWYRQQSRRTLHLFVFEVAIALYALAQAVRPMLGQPDDFLPTPTALFTGVYLLSAAVCFRMATSTSAEADPSAKERPIGPEDWTIWGHFGVATTMILAALPPLAGGGFGPHDLVPATVLAGLLYAGAAQVLSAPKLVRTACVFLIVGSFLWLGADIQHSLLTGGWLMFGIGIAGTALATYSRRQTRELSEEMASAWSEGAIVGALLAWGFAVAYTVSSVVDSKGITPSADLLSSVLAAASGLLFFVGGGRSAKPFVPYVVTLTLCHASAVVVWALTKHSAQLTDVLAPFLLGCSLMALVLSRKQAPQNETDSSNPTQTWLEPLRQLALLAIFATMAEAAYIAFDGTKSVGILWKFAPAIVAQLLLLVSAHHSKTGLRGAIFGSFVALTVLAIGFGTGLYRGIDNWTHLQMSLFAIVTAVYAWLLMVVEMVLGRRYPTENWSAVFSPASSAVGLSVVAVLPFAASASSRISWGQIEQLNAAALGVFALFSARAIQSRSDNSLRLGLAAVASAAVATTLSLQHPTRAFYVPMETAGLLICYAVLYGVVFLHRRSASALAHTAIVLTAAYEFALIAQTGAGLHRPPLLTAPQFAFWSMLASVAWLVAGSLLAKSREEFASPLLDLAAVVELISAVVAVVTANTPHQGIWSIMALCFGGAIWFGIWRVRNSMSSLHLGAGHLIVAWWIVLYDKIGFANDPLDLYLLPVGLYFLALGHGTSRREMPSEARSLWWIGSLSLLSPAFLGYWWTHNGLHTGILIAECLIATLIGVGLRIRAYVAAGLGFAILLLASTLVGQLPDAVGTIVALIVGVGLFVGGYMFLTNREAARQWMAGLQNSMARMALTAGSRKHRIGPGMTDGSGLSGRDGPGGRLCCKPKTPPGVC